MTSAPDVRPSGLVRLFIVSALLAALPAALLAGYAVMRQIDARRATELSHLASETRRSAEALDALAVAVTDHVARARTAYLSALEAGVEPLPRQAVVAGAGGAIFDGATAPEATLMAGKGLLRGRVPELDAFVSILPQLAAAHAVDPHLQWSYIIAEEPDFFVLYPRADETDLLDQLGAATAGALVRSYRSYPVFADGRPEVNPERTPYWTAAYEDAGGAGRMVSYAVPVDAGGRFVGVLGADVLLTLLADFLAGTAASGERAAIVDDHGDVLAATEGAALMPAEGAGDGEVSLDDGLYRVAVRTPHAPWRLVRGVEAAAIEAAVRPNAALAASVAAGLVASAALGFLIFLRGFARPAAALVARVDAQSRGLPPPGRSGWGAWTPWVEAIDGAFEAKREASAMHDAILGVAFDAIVVIDEGGRIVEMADGRDTRFGFDAAAIAGRPMHEFLVPPDLRAHHVAGMARHRKTGQAAMIGRRVETEAMTAAGDRIPVELMIGEAEVRGRRLFVAFLRDIRARRDAESEIARQREALHQSEKLTALGSLLAGVAHELNNPLSVVVGRAIMLEETVDDPRIADSLRRLRDAAQRCGRIAKSFLAIARRSEVSLGPVSPETAVRDALDLNAYALRTTGVEVRVDVPEALPDVLADEGHLVQVLANLVVNAEQALRDVAGPRRIDVRLSRLPPGSVQIEIEDTALGIDPATAARVFEPFFTTKPVGLGTGMGLSISLGMIEGMGGRLTLDPGWGTGAIFRITLPVATAGAGDADEGPHPGAPARILIVDDEPEVAETLAHILEASGHRVIQAGSGVEALDVIGREDVDLVLTDLRMPGMDGITLARRIVAARPGLRDRIMFVTGDNPGPAGAGGWPILEKPFEPEVARRLVASLLAAMRSRT